MSVYIIRWCRVDGGEWEYLPKVFTDLEEAERTRELEQEEDRTCIYRVSEVEDWELLQLIRKLVTGAMERSYSKRERAIIEACKQG